EELLVRRHVLDTDDPLFLDLEDAVDQQHRIAMRQELHDLGDVHHVFFLVRRRSAPSRRANSRNGTAGMPMTFASSGTSSSAALLAAICARWPIRRCPATPDCPATAT